MYNSMVSDVKVKGQRQWACAHNTKVHVVVLSEHSEASWRMSLACASITVPALHNMEDSLRRFFPAR